ncbi:hypothetical protein C0995_014553 [Termitomyces sp. Mi166|nr:hypothetical protein C0995_014553 [Termitomyces sp. Mi166\
MLVNGGYEALQNGLAGMRLRKESVPGVVRSSVYRREEDEEDEVPVKPSAKALGKQRAVEEDPPNYYGEDDYFDDERSTHERWPYYPLWQWFAYDAMAERDKQRIRGLDFPRYSSTDGGPVDWLEQSYKYLLKYINQSVTHTAAQQQCKHWINSTILFPHLISYMYLYFTAETATLEASVNAWREWDLLTALCRLKESGDTLHRCIKSVQPGNQVIENIIALDTDVICTRLHSIMTTDAECYGRLKNLRGSEAQAMLDLFQMLLDLPMLDKIFRSPFLNAMLRLSTQSGLSPSFLLQQQVVLEGTDAVSAGQFGDVWKGWFRGKQVAIKVLKIYLNSDHEKHTKKVLHETLIWRQLRHPNVLPLLCLHHVNNNKLRVGLVSPWMEKGNLKEFLRRTPDVDRVSLVNDIAEGLEYLHTMQPTIVHGDLKAVNILMSNSGSARLADFGLSKASNSQALKLSSFSFGIAGETSRWMAPELLDGRQTASTTQTDVYSFAFVCFEIFSGTIPFPDLNDIPVVLGVMRGLDDNLWQLVERCWLADAFRRPTMTRVVHELPPIKGKSVVIDTDHEYHGMPDPEQRKDLITWAGSLAGFVLLLSAFYEIPPIMKLFSGKPRQPKPDADEEHIFTNPIHQQHTVYQHQQDYMTPPVRAIRHTTSKSEGWQIVQGDNSSQIPSQYSAASWPSPNSSFASLPPGASPPILSLDGSQSLPLLGIGARDRELQPHKLKRKGRMSVPAPRISGALKEQRIATSGPSRSEHCEPEKERRGFWSRGHKDKASGKEREKSTPQDRRGRNGEVAMLARMIGKVEPQGYAIPVEELLTATASEDWGLVSEVTERVSMSGRNAKEVATALRRKFKDGEPTTQLAAARAMDCNQLWAFLLFNAKNDWFVQQSTTCKFTKTIEDLLFSTQTVPIVRERILDVIAAAAYTGEKTTGFRALWKRVKPRDKPEEGIPLDNSNLMPHDKPEEVFCLSGQLLAQNRPPAQGMLLHNNDAMFHTLVPGRPRYDDQVVYQELLPFSTDFPLPSTPDDNPSPKHETPEPRNRVIPPDEDIRRLFQECKIGQESAWHLSQALMSSRPEDLMKKAYEELYLQCRSSQELILEQIPWASVEAEKSCIAKDQEMLMNGQLEDQRLEQTNQEKLLDSLLSANAELMDALHRHDDLKRVATSRTTREFRGMGTDDVSSREMETEIGNALQQDRDYPSHVAGHLRSGSPSPMSATQMTHHYHLAHSHSYSELDRGGLAPHPPAPHGPRSPAPVNTYSRTPSPNLVQDGHEALQDGVTGMMREESAPGVVRSNSYRPEDEVPRELHKPERMSLKDDDTGMSHHSVSSRLQTEYNIPQVVYQDLSLFPPEYPSTSTPRNEFPRYSSSDSRPVVWLEKSYRHLLECINRSVTHVMAEQCKYWINSSILFPHLIVYLYLNFPAERAKLEASVNEWRMWDLLTAICRLKESGHTLGLFIKSLQPGPENQVAKNMVALDTDVICTRLHSIMTTDAECYKRLKNLRGSEAQAMLDLFQMLLDTPTLDKIFRSPFLNAMLRLSTQSGLSPSFLLQRQVVLEGTDPVSAGQFGDVWKGWFHGQQVAVKVLKLYLNSDPAKHTKKVLHEALIWRQLRHPNVLPFLCLHHVNNNKLRLGLVSPWMEKGNLKEFLLRTPDVDRVSLVDDIAEGLEYLHTMQPTIVHGDLKAVNILMSNSGRARLADFGLSTASNSQALKLSSFSFGVTGGTSRWMAPELLDGRQPANTTQTDVYSFAIIFSGTIPFPDLNDFPVMLGVMRGERPLRPKQCEHWKIPCAVLGLNDKLWQLIERCWLADAFQRPTMSSVVRELSLRKGRSVVIGVGH